MVAVIRLAHEIKLEVLLAANRRVVSLGDMVHFDHFVFVVVVVDPPACTEVEEGANAVDARLERGP